MRKGLSQSCDLKGIQGRKRIHPLLCESSCRLTGPWEWIIIIFTKGEFLQLADLWSCKSEHSFSCLSEELLLRKCLLTEPGSVDPFAPYQFFPRLDRVGAVFSAQATGLLLVGWSSSWKLHCGIKLPDNASLFWRLQSFYSSGIIIVFMRKVRQGTWWLQPTFRTAGKSLLFDPTSK